MRLTEYTCRTLLLLLFSNLSSYTQDIRFNSPVSQPFSRRVSFWKKIYSEIDSTFTVVYNSSSLKIYSICMNNRVKTVTDSLRKAVVEPGIVRLKQGRREFVKSAVFRADQHAFISDSLKIHGLHPDLRWLPVLESGYLDTMVSAQGAMGIWQFIPSTGRKYGLSHKEITDPLKSTEAFIRYFSDLLREFDDYALALTAYHHGEGGVRGKLKKYNGSTLEDILPHLGFQSQNYFAKFLAVVDIAHELRKTQPEDTTGIKEQ
jgi:hypothetical protein